MHARTYLVVGLVPVHDGRKHDTHIQAAARVEGAFTGLTPARVCGETQDALRPDGI